MPSKAWQSLAKAPVLSGGCQVSAQDLAKSSETPWALQREARSLLGLQQGPVKALLLSGGQQGTAPGLRKVQGKSQDSREGKRALPQLWKNMEKDPGNAGEKQGSLQVSAKSRKSPRDQGRAARPWEHPGKGLCWGGGAGGALRSHYR